jgi:hypothetical protein
MTANIWRLSRSPGATSALRRATERSKTATFAASTSIEGRRGVVIAGNLDRIVVRGVSASAVSASASSAFGPPLGLHLVRARMKYAEIRRNARCGLMVEIACY